MKLSKPLVVLDLETTGTWIEKDKVIEIGMVKCNLDGSRENYIKRVNPGMPIPPVVQKLIGITNEDIKDAPYFRQIASEVMKFMEGCDFAGFNVERFDLPLLERELFATGLKFEWQSRTIYDSQKIYHVKEKRDLTAAYKFYCKKELNNAHSAMADTEATLEILEAQVSKYGSDDNDIESLRSLNYTSLSEFYDRGRKFRWWNGELYPMFGKYAKRHSLQELASKYSDYLEWILSADFSDEVKDLAHNALRGKYPDYKKESENEPA